ncbi:DUF4402 domain-containing protein [Chitinophaga sp.]|uniref:DUF4402 domain-containing protein n=1 Tax=Chitinophaga sp. TaxID=1869181 RepID=UPI0031D56FF7
MGITKRLLLVMFAMPFCCLGNTAAHAQISVTTARQLSFGAFSQGNAGGTVQVLADGTRSSTGDVILLNMGFLYFPAIFEVEAPQGTVINIMNGPDVPLTGSNGGSMTLHIGSSDQTLPFVSNAVPPARTSVKIGATLTVGTRINNPPGSYSGTFTITFIQE